MRSLSRATQSSLHAALLGVLVVLAGSTAFAGQVSGRFAGAKANTGTVTLDTDKDGVRMLTLSTDFVPPDTPDPHWQVVDSKGTTYLLNRLYVKPEKTLRKSVPVPAYVADVAKVQMWCAWAETLLGEASFDAAMKTSMK